jgi:hypothetical protein
MATALASRSVTAWPVELSYIDDSRITVLGLEIEGTCLHKCGLLHVPPFLGDLSRPVRQMARSPATERETLTLLRSHQYPTDSVQQFDSVYKVLVRM